MVLTAPVPVAVEVSVPVGTMVVTVARPGQFCSPLSFPCVDLRPDWLPVADGMAIPAAGKN